jgi:hypothetical protein
LITLIVAIPVAVAFAEMVMMAVPTTRDRFAVVAVAAAEIVIVDPLMAVMVALAGIPAPEINCPTNSPAVLDTAVMDVVLLVVPTIGVFAPTIAVMTAFVGIPVPATMLPTAGRGAPAVVVSKAGIVGLPEVVVPVKGKRYSAA